MDNNNIPDGYQAGAILSSSWGYDQTNYDFYRIEKRTNDTLFLTPLNSVQTEDAPGAMRGTTVPAEPKKIGDDDMCYKGHRYTGKPFRRRLARADLFFGPFDHVFGRAAVSGPPLVGYSPATSAKWPLSSAFWGPGSGRRRS